MKKTAIALTLVALLSACATSPKDGPVSSLRFNYLTQGGQELGLVRAFDDGARTALQFNVDPPQDLQIVDDQGQSLTYERMGQTIVLQGLYSPLQVKTGKDAATVQAMKSLQTEPLQQNEGLISHSQDDAQAVEIARLRSELKAANATIERLREVSKSSKINDESNVQTTAFSFAFDSAEFDRNSQKALALLPAAKKAKKITVHGFTDSDATNPANKRVSLARAMSAKNYLVINGINPDVIDIKYTPAGNFLANNNTSAGRKINRRVEIRIEQ